MGFESWNEDKGEWIKTKDNDVVFSTIGTWIARIFFSIVIIGGIVVALFGN